MIFGIDISRYQDPDLCDWNRLATDHRVCIIRATSGRLRDRHYEEHIAGADGAGTMTIGAYAWMDQREPHRPQVDAYFETVDGDLAQGDVLPVLDIEAIGATALDVAWWRDAGREFVERAESTYGGCVAYAPFAAFALLDGRDGFEWLARCSRWVSRFRGTHQDESGRWVPTHPDPGTAWDGYQYASEIDADHDGLGDGRTPGYAEGKRPIDLSVWKRVPLIGGVWLTDLGASEPPDTDPRHEIPSEPSHMAIESLRAEVARLRAITADQVATLDDIERSIAALEADL